jgi:tetratricopeptide (TPR) repeat protein
VSQPSAEEALAHFEKARRANDARDYKTACAEFEAAYLLNPKPATLVSTANMYIKMGNASIAAEMYNRLLAERLPQHMHDFIADKLAQIQE